MISGARCIAHARFRKHHHCLRCDRILYDLAQWPWCAQCEDAEDAAKYVSKLWGEDWDSAVDREDWDSAVDGP